MPILQRIELSNFLNSTRAKPWRPDWPHQVLEINGENAALNIPNGKGKSTMVTAILAMLTAHSKSLKDIRTRFFAPVQSGHYTHIRIQVLIPMQGASGDLIEQSGGDFGGQPMVLGMYGYTGENEKLEWYAYQGTFDDAPVAHVHKLHHTLVADDAFLGQLKTCSNLFPSNAKERTKRAWQSYVEDFFDMSSLTQQLIYQLKRGAEGGHGYFEVTQPTGMNYSAAVFYERLAPDLLTDVMGDLGEEGEHGIEDTIHEKVSKVIAAKHETARKAEELRKAENTLRELAGLLDASAKQKQAKQDYDQHRHEFSLELAVLRNVILDDPIPGIPKAPPQTIHEIAKSMVMQDGKWFLPDRALATFTGEEPKVVNQRAHDRNGLELVQANKSQLIDFACDLKASVRAKGHANQLYSHASALGLLKITNNFTRDWAREKALEAVASAFDWVETNADTNPARALQKRLEIELEEKNLKRKQLREESDKHRAEKEKLLTEQSQVGAQQAEYRRMASSGLFTEDEIRTPAITGSAVARTLETGAKLLEEHKDRVRKLGDVYKAWKEFISEHGESAQPADHATKIEEALSSAKKIASDIQAALNTARNQRKSLGNTSNEARQKFNAVDARLNRYLETSPAALKFREVFGDVSPVGLERKVVDALNENQKRLATIVNERKLFGTSLNALKVFSSERPGIDPETWLNQGLSKWETLGAEISQHNNALSEARLKRAALDAAVIFAGQVAREAAQVAGGNHLPLHVAVAKMELDASRREKILTLFSALLHTPVYPSVAEAVDAAYRLEQGEIEAPVFAYPELEEFCRIGTISLDAISSHTWLVGVKTRQVDCLLDPELVEREKELLDEQIDVLNQFIQNKEQERASHSPESAAAAQVRLAIEAVRGGYEAKDMELDDEREKLEATLPDLKYRASDENVKIIRQAELHYKEFKDVDEATLRTEHHACDETMQYAAMTYEANEASIVEAEQRQSAQQEILGAATIDAGKLDTLEKIQAFIEHGEDNPAFMAGAEVREKELSNARTAADNRSRFQFDLADAFIKQGHDRPREIENRLRHLNGEQAEIQDKLLPALDASIPIVQAKIIAMGKNAMSIDVFIRNLIQGYRDFSVMQDDLVEISQKQIESRTLGGAAIGLREAGLEDRVTMLNDISSEIEQDNAAGIRDDMNGARSRHTITKTAFAALVDKILIMSDLDMTEHVRLELVRSKENPEIVDHLHAVATQNFEKNSAANATAAAYLESEWENIGKWLKSFTQRLPDNLRTMKEVFSPIKDKISGEYLSAGFEIEAKLADQEDIKAILDDVVKMVEKFESTRHAVESAAPGIRDQAVRGMRAEIRNTFYHKVITNPRIKVCMPSISKHSLPLEKGMVSTGQGVAMTLLWVVKMADYVTERELRRVTTSRVQQKHLHPTQFAIMDGAFSSLSNKGLIQDALNSIKGTRGRFQLIITGHDENYQNNFEYFPTLIEAREINGQFMYADSKTKRVLQPEEVGSHYGAIGVMNLRVKPQQEGAAAI